MRSVSQILGMSTNNTNIYWVNPNISVRHQLTANFGLQTLLLMNKHYPSICVWMFILLFWMNPKCAARAAASDNGNLSRSKSLQRDVWKVGRKQGTCLQESKDTIYRLPKARSRYSSPNSLLQHAVEPTSLLQTTSNAGRVCHQAATTMLTNFPVRSGPKTWCQTCLPTHPVPS